MVSLEIFIDIILPAPIWPWGWLSLWQKWVPGIFPGGNGGLCVRLTPLPNLCADCLEIWEPQPPGTLRACPGLQWDCFIILLSGSSHDGSSGDPSPSVFGRCPARLSVATSECNYCGLILEFCRGVNKIFALLGCYRAQIGRFLSKLRGTLSAPNSTVKQTKLESLNFGDGGR